MRNRGQSKGTLPFSMSFVALLAAGMLVSSCGDDGDNKEDGASGPGTLPNVPAITNTADESTIAARAQSQTEFATDYVDSLEAVLSGPKTFLAETDDDSNESAFNPISNLQSLSGNATVVASSGIVPVNLKSLVSNSSSAMPCYDSLSVLKDIADLGETLSLAKDLGQIPTQSEGVAQVEFTRNPVSDSEAINYTVKTSAAFSTESGSSADTTFSAGSDDSVFFLRQVSNFTLDMGKFFEAINKIVPGNESGTDSSDFLSSLSGTATGSVGAVLEADTSAKILTVRQQLVNSSTITLDGQAFRGSTNSLKTTEINATAGTITVTQSGTDTSEGNSLNISTNHKISKVSDSSLLFEFSWSLNKGGAVKDVSTKITVTKDNEGNCTATVEGNIDTDEIEDFTSLK